LIPVVDRSILEHQVAALHTLGASIPVQNIFVNAHHLAPQIEQASQRLGIDQVFVEYPNILGTGGPLRRIYEAGFQNELLILNGDNYHAFDLAAFIRAARVSGAPFALLCVDHAPTNVLHCNAQGMVCGRDGKYAVDLASRKMTFSGVAWYAGATLARIREDDFNVVDFWKREAETGRLPLAYTAQSERTWIDMGTPEGLYQACLARLDELGVDRWISSETNCLDSQVGCHAVVSAEVQIGSGTVLENCLVLPGTSIVAHSQIKNVVIGPDFMWNL
jgi:NDP-sugar pyrophosphorylase family protein